MYIAVAYRHCKQNAILLNYIEKDLKKQGLILDKKS